MLRLFIARAKTITNSREFRAIGTDIFTILSMTMATMMMMILLVIDYPRDIRTCVQTGVSSGSSESARRTLPTARDE